ncbi:bifunctional proline dehydrogenase/L-glutamate gamma-semialdehyde dehydrogenase PutA [Vannielia sp.]|uniref:bifunctional proline dehydrogenase/L-glutamate gamma-semialdehyde dehydrogenase PutA n=1 Tax=Vannielia sp. TaxID=2813045 RepID=UPI0026376963|nr:bifunctional proline dehydrogenase/L-glutamate gamma-semialdehyde dehydrogenase PutA [Vannielia sp.]MDF1871820.1 bifunctional proline dehydrogenase/L-glutamate gamma-semialdehyde dehydrogenase PutA [Vannielia sp.]
MINLDPKWDAGKRRDEAELLAALQAEAALTGDDRSQIVATAADLVRRIRTEARPSLMDVFLGEYGLSTEEGVALMCLAEALLRVPDATTMDALIEDKIAPSNWSAHLGHSASPLVNASTWGLLLTGKVLAPEATGVAGTLKRLVRRLGEPVIRTAVSRSMREMGRQFVLGQTIQEAMERAARNKETEGFTYSYDMLGEAAMTAPDAARYAASYEAAIGAIASGCNSADVAENPGISVKLSALHPRYEVAKTERVMAELVPVLSRLCRRAAEAGMGLNVDAEEADRLGLSLAVMEAALDDPSLAGWDGFGVVVQAYGRRAGEVIDGIQTLAKRRGQRIMLRLVKGAYWDSEIKRAQVEGLVDFPVFTRKPASDVSYIALARRLLAMTDWIYPQFATHNAHTVAAVLHMAKSVPCGAYEFQRLHGMGEALHDMIKAAHGTRCRIYAPVGAHRDLLAYLVRRLLENGANSSFVNQIVDESVPPEVVAACPFAALESAGPSQLRTGPKLYAGRKNSQGFDLQDVTMLRRIAEARVPPEQWRVGPVLAGVVTGSTVEKVHNPATGALIGEVAASSAADVKTALEAARPWSAPVGDRANTLRRAADRYEADYGRLFALLATEAGKTLADAVAELREAVDFLRYYADEAERTALEPRGIFTCISPWNFPLAIFTGQIAAASAAGNGVLAKPAETTPAIADWAVRHLLAAGVPATALQLLPGEGGQIGAALTGDPKVNGVAFTGSTATARTIQAEMAQHLAPGTPLIAETGGLNAMIVDSTALPEQAVRDIVASAFQSAGQRCSALRCLYVQEDVADGVIRMLKGAMDELALGDPWQIATDVGPVITAQAQSGISAHVATAAAEGRVLHQVAAPREGYFVPPVLIKIAGIADLEQEVFGPVLHVATFKAEALGEVIAAVNATGYGLTFGLHSRIDDRVQRIAEEVEAGNIYANRNQIGAIVGSQPFGGEGLSGTGPKAGGPHYITRFSKPRAGSPASATQSVDEAAVRMALTQAKPPVVTSRIDLPGPTGELNRLTTLSRPPLLCLGPDVAAQMQAVTALGGQAIAAGALAPEALEHLPPFGAALWWGGDDEGRAYARALARRDGPILPLVTTMPDAAHVLHERHLCVDVTAAGGNTSLLAGTDS